MEAVYQKQYHIHTQCICTSTYISISMYHVCGTPGILYYMYSYEHGYYVELFLNRMTLTKNRSSWPKPKPGRQSLPESVSN